MASDSGDLCGSRVHCAQRRARVWQTSPESPHASEDRMAGHRVVKSASGLG